MITMLCCLCMDCANPPIRKWEEREKIKEMMDRRKVHFFLHLTNYSISIKISHLFYRLDLVSHSHYSFHFGQRCYEGLFHRLNELKHLHNVCWFSCTMPKEENCVVWHFALLFARAFHFLLLLFLLLFFISLLYGASATYKFLFKPSMCFS